MRGKMTTRYDYRNVNADCTGCNNSHYSKYEQKDMAALCRGHRQKMGARAANKLYRISQDSGNWDVSELDQLSAAARLGFPVCKQLYDELTN